MGGTEEEQRKGYLDEVSPRWHPQGECGADERRHVFIWLLLCGRRCAGHRVTKENLHSGRDTDRN